MAVTGKGDFPLRSTWLQMPCQMYRGITWGDVNDAPKTIWSDYFFEAAAGGAFTLVADPGSYSWTGSAASLLYNRLVLATGGLVLHTGNHGGGPYCGVSFGPAWSRDLRGAMDECVIGNPSIADPTLALARAASAHATKQED